MPLASLEAEAAVLAVAGKGVSVMGCGVRPRRAVVAVRKFEPPPGWAVADPGAEPDSDAVPFRVASATTVPSR